VSKSSCDASISLLEAHDEHRNSKKLKAARLDLSATEALTITR
jgi:hypothetical protein